MLNNYQSSPYHANPYSLASHVTEAQESDDDEGDGEHDEELLRWEQEQIKKGTVNTLQVGEG